MDTIGSLAAATPVTRERYIDLLRALSIGVVVIGHWLLAIVTWGEGGVRGANALAELDGIWILTWLFQVMPLFFFVGGFSNLRSWDSARRDGAGATAFVRARFTRLLRPTAVFAGVWIVAARLLPALGAPRDVVGDVAAIVAIPLWFMAVYLIVIAVTPATAAAHRRWGLRVPAVLLGSALVIDVLTRGLGVPAVGMLNFVAVWLLPHQLGYAYADGTLTRAPARAHAAFGALCLGAVAALTVTGVYAGSMVGVPGAADSNNSPPTFALALHGLWMVGLAMALRAPANRWLARPRPWRAVVGVNAVIMTVFLWHMTALVVGALIVLPIGLPQPDPGSLAWWALRPLWIAILAAVLAPLVRLFGPVEIRALTAARPAAALHASRERRPTARPEAVSTTAARPAAARPWWPQVAAGAVAATLGVMVFAHQGFGADAICFVGPITVTPLTGAAGLAFGLVCLRRSERRASGPMVSTDPDAVTTGAAP